MFECATCEYVQTEEPYWLEQAYARPINDSDTGILERNAVNARIVLASLWTVGDIHGRIVDYAGGYGILVRMLRDYGMDALWSDAFCENLLARGFEHRGEPAILVTAFEAFEHFVEPALELEKMLAVAPNVLLSTLLLPKPAPDAWWYYGVEHGQHVGLFRLATLQTLSRAFGAHLMSDGVSYHLISKEPTSQQVWRVLLRLNRLVAPILRKRLSSRTWSDHELVARGDSSDFGN